MTSWTFAPVTIAASGLPLAAVSMRRLEPGRAQSIGFGPVFDPLQGDAVMNRQRLYAGIKPGAVLMKDGYKLYNGIAHNHQLVHPGCRAPLRACGKAEDTVPKADGTPGLLATCFIHHVITLLLPSSAGQPVPRYLHAATSSFGSPEKSVFAHQFSRTGPFIATGWSSRMQRAMAITAFRLLCAQRSDCRFDVVRYEKPVQHAIYEPHRVQMS
ncbi:hypothetical protein WL42_26105 [Burkholderia ubonensis]|nr:hypothetical protein WL42_26105 [Burkholderia ubonensis]